MNQPTVGKLITKSNQQRDAIHVAIAPVIAMDEIFPGSRIGFSSLDNNEGRFVIMCPEKSSVGIADPFLKRKILKGEEFWMFLYPSSIKSIRHDWSHPRFPDSINNDETSKMLNEINKQNDAWSVINEFASAADMTSSDLIEHATNFIKTGEYVIDGGKYEGCWLDDRFWDAYDIITGKTTSSSDRGGVFSCSC